MLCCCCSAGWTRANTVRRGRELERCEMVKATQALSALARARLCTLANRMRQRRRRQRFRLLVEDTQLSRPRRDDGDSKRSSNGINIYTFDLERGPVDENTIIWTCSQSTLAQPLVNRTLLPRGRVPPRRSHSVSLFRSVCAPFPFSLDARRCAVHNPYLRPLSVACFSLKSRSLRQKKLFGWRGEDGGNGPKKGKEEGRKMRKKCASLNSNSEFPVRCVLSVSFDCVRR